MAKVKCIPIQNARRPVLTNYALDVELYEGIHLQGGKDRYQVDVSWGHTLSLPEKREQGGHVWDTFVSRKGKRNEYDAIEFLEKRTLSALGLPSVEHARAVDYTGEEHLVEHVQSQIPDIIVTVSRVDDRSNPIGFLRIPLTGRKRPTENWENGEDLTLVDHLWEFDKGSAQCFPLSDVVERYDAISNFLLVRIRVETIELGEELGTPKSIELPPVVRKPYTLTTHIYQAKGLASADKSGLSNPFATARLQNKLLKTNANQRTCHPLWFETLSTELVLPEYLQWAPDLVVAVYHDKKGCVLRWGDKKLFMGKAQLKCIEIGEAGGVHKPRWYPLQFEELEYGEILISATLVPTSLERNVLRPSINLQNSLFLGNNISNLVESWVSYEVKVSALALRGVLWKTVESKLKKKPNTRLEYEIESWGECWLPLSCWIFVSFSLSIHIYAYIYCSSVFLSLCVCVCVYPLSLCLS